MRSLGFGIERMGLIPIRYPERTLALLAAFTAFCVVGLFSLQPEGRLSEIYRGTSANYAEYEKISKLFPVSELDVLLLISGKNLLGRKAINDMRAIQEEVDFLEGVDSTLSMFSLRGKPDRTGKSPPLFPAELTSAKKRIYNRVLKAIEEHPDVYGNMLTKKAKDGHQTSLIVVTLKDEAIKEGTLYGVLENLKKQVSKIANPANLTFQLSGAPVIQQEIRNSINHDMVVFNLGGFLLGTLISFYFIRRFALVIMVSIASILANIWVLGILGHFDQTLNAFMTIVPPLIMVIAVSDGMHMVLAILQEMQQGASKREAVKKTVLSIGPACVLTSLTTTIALLSMTITDSAIIRTFGITAAMGTLAAFIAVILVIPTLSMLMIKDEKDYRADPNEKDKTWNALQKIENLSMGFSHWTHKWWKDLAIVGLIVCAFFTVLHLQLKPQYKLSDEIPDVPALTSAMDLVDEQLGGGDYIHILVSYGKNKTPTSPDVLASIGEAHRLLSSLSQVSDVNSLEKTRLWFRNNGIKSNKALKLYIDKMPDHVRQRLINKEKHAAIVSAKIANLDSPELAQLVKRIKKNLKNMEEEFPDIKFTISGLSTVSALQSTNIIGQLNQGLLLAIVIVVGLIGVAFRSLSTAIISIAPNLFPIVAAGAVLHFTDSGLQFASILGLTVAFGLAVDDSIHFFNRYHLERDRLLAEHKSNNQAEEEDHTTKTREIFDQEVQCVKNTIAHIGPVLILTTAILICGLSVTILSNLSVTRLFGELSMATLSAALIADLFFLPALIIAAAYLKRLYKGLLNVKI